MARKTNKEVDNVVTDVPEPSDLTMDDLTQEEEFPKPDEEAIAAITRQNTEPVNQPINYKPASKVENFDPAIHRADDAGKPILTKTGKFRKKTGWKFVRPEDKKADAPETPALTSKAAAEITSGLLEQISVTVISDEFIYSDIERASNIKAWEDCYEYYGGVHLSPPMALAANHVAIIVARAHKPKTLSKFSVAAAWVKSKFKRKNKKDGAHSNSGNDRSGQNNVGAEKVPLASA